MSRMIRGRALRQAARLTLLVSACLHVGAAHPLVALQTPASAIALAEILARAATYVVDFEKAFSNVVAEEHYIQQATTSQPPRQVPGSPFFETPRPIVERRELRSDFLLVKLPDENRWIPFRDVFEVNGRPVRDREARLANLFLQPIRTALDQARKIMAESARYNLGAIERTVNVPVFALEVLHPANQSRFRFSALRPDPGSGPDVYAVAYQEVTGPTLVQGIDGRELFARGRFWIEARSGQVVRSELAIDHPSVLGRDSARGQSPVHPSVEASITTLYRSDPAFTVAVPVEMREDYRFPDWAGSQVTGVATYGHFRRFDVQVEEEVILPR